MNNSKFGNTCVCIARVSTSQQDYEAQTKALHNKASELGLSVIKDIETKESGFRSMENKEGFNELVKFMKDNGCKIVICTELSRLARKKFLLEQIKQWFIDNNIQLYVMDLNFFLFDEFGNTSMTTDIVFSVHASIADSEMRNKAQRLKRGKAELVKQGYSIPGKVLFGYVRKKAAVKIKGKDRSILEIDPKAAKEIRDIFDWYLHGIDGDIKRCSAEKIKDECILRGYSKYLHSKRNVNNALKNASYTGHIVTNNLMKNPRYWNYGESDQPKYIKCSSEMTFPPIIDQYTFDAVQKKMSSCTTMTVDKSTKHFTLLSKLIVCPTCKGLYIGDYRIISGIERYSYRCQKHKSHGSFQISMFILDFALWKFCRLHFTKFLEYVQSSPRMKNEEDVEKRINEAQKKKQELENELLELSKRYLRVSSVVSNAALEEEFLNNCNRLNKEILHYNDIVSKELSELQNIRSAESIAKATQDTADYIENNKYEMRKYINLVVKRVLPLFHDGRYVVVEIELQNESMAFYTCEPDEVELVPEIHRYIIIEKKTTQHSKIRYISAPCIFDIDNKLFYLYHNTTATLENVFDDTDEVYFHEFANYAKLPIYNEDQPNKGVSRCESNMNNIMVSERQN